MPLGLPDRVRAWLFDMDGVLTDTASVHAAAWRQTFDSFLEARDGDDFTPFSQSDYEKYVDGRSRLDGTRAFLRSRGIQLPEGTDGDPPGSPTVHGLAAQKNRILISRLRTDGVHVFPDSLAYLRAVASAGYSRAVVSASANTRHVLEAAGIADLFDARIDGLVALHRHLAGKPAPDMFLAAAGTLGVPASEAAVFEDALAGVEAGRAGGFGFVVGVDRVGQADALRAHGADLVVSDVSSLLAGAGDGTGGRR